jgi:protein TonB
MRFAQPTSTRHRQDPIEFALLDGSGAAPRARPAAPAPLLGDGMGGAPAPIKATAVTKARPIAHVPKARERVRQKPVERAPSPGAEIGALAALVPSPTPSGSASDASTGLGAGGHPTGSAAGSREGVVGGAVGGVPGGVAGGVVGGTGTGTGDGLGGGAKFVPPSVASAQRLFSPDPPYTPAAQTAGVEGTVTAKICVNDRGNVSSVNIMRHLAMGMDSSVTDTVKTWRFRPFVYNGRPVPFCYVANFVYQLR